MGERGEIERGKEQASEISVWGGERQQQRKRQRERKEFEEQNRPIDQSDYPFGCSAVVTLSGAVC